MFELFEALIGNLGFPIAVCICCFWLIKKMSDNHKTEIEKLQEIVQSERLEYNAKVDTFVQAINNNTTVMEKFLTVFNNSNHEVK